MNHRPSRPYAGVKKSIWLRVIVALFLLVAVTFATLVCVILANGHTSVTGQPKVMIIFGCKVEQWGPSVLLQDRLNTALDYLKEHPDTLVVVTGGQGPDEPTTEAQAMYDYLVAGGAVGEKILLEGSSSSTWENLNYSHDLLRAQGYEEEMDELLLVSNGFHLARIRMLVGRVWTGDYTVSSLAAPSSHVPSRLKMYVREPLALIKSLIVDR